MRETGSLRPAVSAALALAVIAACTPVTTAPPAEPAPRSRVVGSPLVGRASTTPPGPSGEPASPSPLGSSPAPTPAGTPAGSTSPDPRRARIEAKLLTLAKVAFGQNRGQLASTRVFDAPGGAALLGNNGAGIISNNGGGLVGGNTAGYALAQATSGPLAIATTAQPGETLVARRLWPDGTTLLRFDRPGTGADVVRRVVHLRDARPFYEETREVLARWPDGGERATRTTTLELIADGRFGVRLVQRGEGDEAGRTTRIALEPGSVVRDEATGGVTAIEELDYDLVARTATFRYVHESLDLVETGTLSGVRDALGGGVTIAFWDPLALDDGESRVTDRAGTLVYTKRQRTVDGKVLRDFDLGGVTLALARAADNRYTGRLADGGLAIADVTLEARTDGSAVFTVAFDDEPGRPLVIGYGLTGETPAARPTSPPQYVVLTSAGAEAPGHVNGPAAEARFDGPQALVASRLSSGKLYLADTRNHRVRLVTKGPFAVAPLAGDGTAGHRDGAAAQARFNEPFGLAVGADDTLYVSDSAGHRVRAIAPDGTVSTLAGDGTAGLLDGEGAAARFDHPTGLALDGLGGLYVADALNHAIRRVETTGPDRGRVSTLAGDGSAGLRDGTGSEARFNLPLGLALGPDGALYVADRDNHRIRRLTFADPGHPVVTTAAGTSDPARLFMDGPAAEARFNPPHFLAFGADGALYFTTGADVYALQAGEVRSYAGVGAPGWRDGAAKFAAFSDCQGLAFAPNGVLHLMDGNRLRAIVPPAAMGR